MVIARVEHEGFDPEGLQGGGSEGGRPRGNAQPYRNRFECLPADAELRQRARTPKPKIYGPQTAIVVGKSASLKVPLWTRLDASYRVTAHNADYSSEPSNNAVCPSHAVMRPSDKTTTRSNHCRTSLS